MALEIQSLEVEIGKKTIIDDVSLTVSSQQMVGIIGANGSGKSTLLKSIYKSLKPKKGTIVLNQLDLLKTSEKKVSQKVGVVGQFNEVSFDFSVFQMVLLGRTPHKKLLETDSLADMEIVEAALKQTGLSAYRDRSFLSLSGGEKQRVILARALTQKPEYLILDEPTNHLDIRYQLEIMSCVRNLGIGVLAALHDLEMAAAYCDYLVAMKEGKVLAAGKPEELLTEALVKEIYQVNCSIYRNPVTEKMSFAYHL